MTVPLIATQSEFLSLQRAYRWPCPSLSPSPRVRPPSLSPVCPHKPGVGRLLRRQGFVGTHLLTGVTFTANKVYTSSALQTQQLPGEPLLLLKIFSKFS